MWPWISKKFKQFSPLECSFHGFCCQLITCSSESPAPKRMSQETPGDLVWQSDCSARRPSSAHTTAVTAAALQCSLVSGAQSFPLKSEGKSNPKLLLKHLYPLPVLQQRLLPLANEAKDVLALVKYKSRGSSLHSGLRRTFSLAPAQHHHLATSNGWTTSRGAINL